MFVLCNKNKESPFIDPVMDTAHMDTAHIHAWTSIHRHSTHGHSIHETTTAILIGLFVSDDLIRTSGFIAQTPGSLPGHKVHADFGAFPTFLV